MMLYHLPESLYNEENIMKQHSWNRGMLYITKSLI